MAFLKWPRSNLKRLLLLTFLLVAIYLIQLSYLYSIAKKYGKKKEEKSQLGNKFPNFKNCGEKMFEGEKLIHLDLKGAPPKVTYLLNFIPLIKRLGATGLLIEYEDMFPYRDGLEDITALNSYNPSDIASIVQTAEINNLTVIPLIPTFSHFEFVLKLKQYKEYRESENNPQILCPGREKVYFILEKMIDQVLEAHNTSKYLHIGCDEAEFIGFCYKCQKLRREKKWRKDNIYFNHVKKIGEYIIKNYPGVQPIIWGDKFIKRNKKIILSLGIPDVLEVMLWNYGPEKSYFSPNDDIEFLTKLFKNIWIASTFKGAAGCTKIVTDINYHLKNSRIWIEFVDKWKNAINFKGIALSGWQRNNHFGVLCELLPVGIPSLALNLQYLNLNPRKLFDYKEVKQSLNCSHIIPKNLHEIKDLVLLSKLKCHFPGFKVYHIIHLFYNALLRLKSTLTSSETRDLSFYGIVNNVSNPACVRELNIKIYEQKLLELNDLKNEIKNAMKEIYDEYTINEWIMTYVAPAEMHMEASINIIHFIHNMKVWPRRPFVNEELKTKHFFNKICTKDEILGCAFLNIPNSFL